MTNSAAESDLPGVCVCIIANFKQAREYRDDRIMARYHHAAGGLEKSLVSTVTRSKEIRYAAGKMEAFEKAKPYVPSSEKGQIGVKLLKKGEGRPI